MNREHTKHFDGLTMGRWLYHANITSLSIVKRNLKAELVYVTTPRLYYGKGSGPHEILALTGGSCVTWLTRFWPSWQNLQPPACKVYVKSSNYETTIKLGFEEEGEVGQTKLSQILSFCQEIRAVYRGISHSASHC